MPTFTSKSFNGGETAFLVDARDDQQRRKYGCKKLYNAVCLPQGPATRRPGTRYVATVKETTLTNTVILVPFVFSANESRVLEFGNNYMRVITEDGLVMSGGSPYELATGLSYAQLRAMRFAQSADVIYVASTSYLPKKISRYADDNWTIENINFIPQAEKPARPTLAATVGVATSGKATYRYVITAIDNATGEESLPSSNRAVTTSILNQVDGNYIDISWTANSVQPAEYRIYKYEAGLYGYIGTVSGTTLTFRDDNIGADESDTPPTGDNPFDSAGNYPGLVFFFQQRLGWAATLNEPFNVWFSPSAQFESLAASVPPADDDAITARLAAPRADKIQWVAADRTLVIGTTGNEWAYGGTDGEAITPSSGFSWQGSNGSESLPPLALGESILYVQRGGDIVREFIYSYNVDKYETTDVSIMASHLFDGKTVVNWCYQAAPFSIAWILLDDGTLRGLTAVREHSVAGWHQHETEGFIEDICCIPGQNGYDLVYLLVRREINSSTVRYIEKFDNYFVRIEDKEDAFFVDSGATYTGAAATTFAGLLPHLVGETVKVWADGVQRPDVVVAAGGDITFPAGSESASKVSAGLGFVSDIKPNRPELTTDEETTLTRYYKVNKVALKLFRTADIQVGLSEDSLFDVLQHDPASPIDPAYIENGDVETVLIGDWPSEWDFTIRAANSGPMTVCAVVYSAEVGEDI